MRVWLQCRRCYRLIGIELQDLLVTPLMPPVVGKSNKRLLKAGWMSTNGVSGLLPLGPVAK